METKNEEIFKKNKITEPKNICDFLNNCIDEIINLKNENYILKNNMNDLDLNINLTKEQINDFQKENYNLKKIIGNYTSEFDNKNKIINHFESRIKEIETYLKKEINDKKFILSILFRILNLYPNNKLVNLFYKAFNEDLNYQTSNINNNLFSLIINEIKFFENYIIELKDKKSKYDISNYEKYK